MKEHPIPQDIVGYRFHIVGNMTIKQFAEIAGGAFVAFIFWTTNLVPVIKWPLMGISFAFGAAMAFVPFEERPLDHWVTTFFKVLYRPTKFYWRRQAKIPEPFLYKSDPNKKKPENEIDFSPARRQRIKDYLQSIDAYKPQDEYDLQSQRRVTEILNTFDSMVVNQHATTDEDFRPNLKVRVRNLRADSIPEDFFAAEIIEEEVEAQADIDRRSLELRSPLSVAEVAQDIVVPEQEVIQVGDYSQLADQQDAYAQNQQGAVYSTQDASQQAVVTSSQAVFNQNLPFPSKPSQPNLLVGMVLSPTNELINDAIIEIKNGEGRTVRAVKTNALGQFFISTPLRDGDYFIQAEKEGRGFTPLQLSLNNNVVEPIEIRSVA